MDLIRPGTRLREARFGPTRFGRGDVTPFGSGKTILGIRGGAEQRSGDHEQSEDSMPNAHFCS
jgi:hypothetical protein